MRQSYYELYIHIIWTTKNREAMIKRNIENTVHTIIKEKCLKFNINLLAIGNTEDHIHLLLAINPNIKISEFIKEAKGASTYFINHKTNESLYWQDGYGVLSVGKRQIDFIKKYIENQKSHHNANKIDLILEKIECS